LEKAVARQGPTNYHGSYHLLRINQGRNFRPRGHTQFVWVRDLVGPVGMRWRGAGSAFAASAWQLARPLGAWWGARPADPWGVRTDLPPDDCAAQWDARRGGCDPCFNCGQRGGWPWQQTQRPDPARAARRWLAMAVAPLGMLTVGRATTVPICRI